MGRDLVGWDGTGGTGWDWVVVLRKLITGPHAGSRGAANLFNHLQVLVMSNRSLHAGERLLTHRYELPFRGPDRNRLAAIVTHEAVVASWVDLKNRRRRWRWLG